MVILQQANMTGCTPGCVCAALLACCILLLLLLLLVQLQPSLLMPCSAATAMLYFTFAAPEQLLLPL
jgi:hypothetical protein